MKKIIGFMVVLGASFLLYGCTSSTQNPYGAPAAPVNVTPPSQDQPAAVTSEKKVSIINFSFTPSPLTIQTGTKVTWTNNDSAPHQIKSATFNSSVLSNGQTFSFTFATPGTYNYSCAIHPSMTGQIVVE